MNLLKSDEYPAVYAPYIETVVGDIVALLREQLDTFPDFLDRIPPGKSEYAYAEGKWTIKEVVGHIIDTERIVATARFNQRSLENYAEEFVWVRRSNLILFENLNDHELSRRGLVAERLISVRAFMYIIAGHLNHHRNIIRERYLGE